MRNLKRTVGKKGEVIKHFITHMVAVYVQNEDGTNCSTQHQALQKANITRETPPSNRAYMSHENI